MDFLSLIKRTGCTWGSIWEVCENKAHVQMQLGFLPRLIEIMNHCEDIL